MTRLVSGALVSAMAGAVLLVGGVANAAPPAGTLGSLTITPATGTDISAVSARTSAACPSNSDSANMLIVGPIGAANPTFPASNPYPIVTTNSATFSTVAPFDLPFRKILRDAATERGTTLQTGEYDITAQCGAGFPFAVTGTFTGAMYFTSPTAYQTTDPNAGPTATTTTLTTNPVSPVTQGTSVALNAAVSPSAAGSVQFKDGAGSIGAAVPVAGGTASTTTSTLTAGTHSLTAVFTPTDPAAFGPSTSPAVSFVVNTSSGATATTTTLSVTPSGSVSQGTSVTLNGSVSPAAAAGSIQFTDGGTNLGAPVPVAGGTASTTTSTLAVGSHSLAASFIPANPAAFGASSSQPVPLTVTGSGGGTGSTATETITTTIASGSLVISVANTNVTLPSPALNPAGTLLSTSGNINPITVTDTRAGNPGWTVSGQVTDFSDGASHAINGANLGWAPHVIDKAAAQTVTPGATIDPANGIAPGASPPAGIGLSVSRTLATAATLAGIGTAHLDALLNLNVPTSTTAGTYTTTLTLTAI
ncbi:MAG TPA: Ig-like domain repeat protein [Pseudonocardiaceae bacterium]